MILALIGLFLMLVTDDLRKGGATKINRNYGFRTKKSMKNQANWQKAQKLAGERGRTYGIAMILVGLALAAILYPIALKNGNFSQVLLLEGLLVAMSLIFLVMGINNKLP